MRDYLKLLYKGVNLKDNFYKPDEIYNLMISSAVDKTKLSNLKVLLLGILAGAYIAFAAHLATTIATGSIDWFGLKKFFVGAVFSVGLMLVIIPGSELWTGNNLMIASLFEKKISITAMLKNWIIVFFGNFIGSVLVAIIIVKYGGLLDGAVGGTAIKIANAKINFTPHGVSHNVAYFFRAIGCNWLVCLAVLMAIASKDITGKIFAIFFPIMAFVASGFEHSIANMYFLSAGIFAKSFPTAVSFSGLNTSLLDSLNWVNIWSSNLIVVTLGNLVGGGFFVATFYYFINRK